MHQHALKKTQYGVWLIEDPEDDSSIAYWELFDSIEDAVAAHPEDEIYNLTAKCLGKFHIQAVPIPRPKRKK